MLKQKSDVYTSDLTAFARPRPPPATESAKCSIAQPSAVAAPPLRRCRVPRSGGPVAGARQRKPGEVVGALVHLLRERDLRVEQPTGYEHSVDLLHGTLGVDEVFEHRRGDHRVEGLIAERQRVRVGDHVESTSSATLRMSP